MTIQCRRRYFRYLIPIRERYNLFGGCPKTSSGRIDLSRSLPGRALRPAFSVSTGLWFFLLNFGFVTLEASAY